MKVYTNTKAIQRRQRFGIWTSVIGFAIMFGSLFATRQPEYVIFAWLGLFLGLSIALVGTYHVNRWIRPPQASKLLADALARLDARHVLFNHIGVVPHLLLTPKGLIAIRANAYEGTVGYDAARTRWLGRVSPWQYYVRGLTPVRLGDPGEAITQTRNEVIAWLQRHLPEHADDIPVTGITLFVSPDTTLDVQDEPVLVAQPDSIKKAVRLALKDEPPLPREVYLQLREQLEQEATEAIGAADEADADEES